MTSAEQSVEQQVKRYFFTGERLEEYVAKSKRETIAFIDKNIGWLSLTEEQGARRWDARLIGGQNIGDACLAAYYLTSASKIPVQFDANGTRFLIAEIK